MFFVLPQDLKTYSWKVLSKKTMNPTPIKRDKTKREIAHKGGKYMITKAAKDSNNADA